MDSIVEKYVKFDKSGKGHYLSLLKKIIYDGVRGVHKHIMKLLDYYNKLKDMNARLGRQFLDLASSVVSSFTI